MSRLSITDRTTATRLSVLLLSLLLVLSVATGCGGGAKNAGTKSSDIVEGGTVQIGLEEEPAILNPFLNGGQTVATAEIVQNVVPGLFRIRPDYTYEPYLLEKEPNADDGSIKETPFTVTYTLKKGVKWDDGKPITSKDILFTWRSVMDPENQTVVSRAGYEKIESIRTPDDRTAVLTFKEPYPAWRDLFTIASGAGVLPQHLLKDLDFEDAMLRSLDFSGGPYRFEEWVTGQSLTLVRNDRFWGKKPHLDKLVFRFNPDASTMRELLRNEELDIIVPAPDADLVAQLKRLPGVKVQAGSGTLWEQMAFNTAQAPLNDVNVRRGIASAIDRQGIVQELLKGNAKTLQAVIVPELGEVSSPTFEQYTRDPQKAEGYLTAAGYTKATDDAWFKGDKKLSVRISTTAEDPGREKVEQVIADNLKSIGIDAKIENFDPDTFFNKVQGGEYELGIWAWQQSPDPGLAGLFASDQIGTGQNVYAYRNADVTALLNEAERKVDTRERTELLVRAQKTIADEAPILPLYQRLAIIAYTDRLQGAKLSTAPSGNTWNSADWWLER